MRPKAARHVTPTTLIKIDSMRTPEEKRKHATRASVPVPRQQQQSQQTRASAPPPRINQVAAEPYRVNVVQGGQAYRGSQAPQRGQANPSFAAILAQQAEDIAKQQAERASAVLGVPKKPPVPRGYQQ